MPYWATKKPKAPDPRPTSTLHLSPHSPPSLLSLSSLSTYLLLAASLLGTYFLPSTIIIITHGKLLPWSRYIDRYSLRYTVKGGGV